MKKRKSTNDFIVQAKEVHGDKYDYSKSEYINEVVSVGIICKEHGLFYQLPRNHVEAKQNCPKCSIKNNSSKRKFTTEFIIDRAKQIHGDKYDYSKVKYYGIDKPITIICNKHGEFEQKAYQHINKKQGCPKCGIDRNKVMQKGFYKQLTKEQVIDNINKVHDNKYIIHDFEYKGYLTPITLECKEHGLFTRNYKAIVNNGYGCRKCSLKKQGEKNKLSQEEVIEKLKYKLPNYNFDKFVYKGYKNKSIIICDKNHETRMSVQSLLEGHKCNRCSNMVSLWEKEIIDYIKSIYNGKIINSDRKILNGKELDIYLPELNIAIECNGIYYHSTKCGCNNNYHLEKTKLCNAKGIRLLHIFDDEWRDKQDIIKSRIENWLGLTKNKIYARKCSVMEVCTDVKNEFLKRNHIQGSVGSIINLGLYYDGELVSVMTFGLDRTGYFVLNRFASKLHTVVNGGFSKIFKYFLENYPEYKEIKSLADNTISEGNLYEKNGFTLERVTKPDYFYVYQGKRVRKQNFMKKTLVEQGFDKNKTELQIMEERGIPRIYDCGKRVYIYRR